MKFVSLPKFCLLLAIWRCFGPLGLKAAVSVSLSPSVTSNTYSAPVTLQVKGLTNGETVVVQKFLDVNTNGVVDKADPLWQQFNLTDGQAMVIGGVTDLDVPGDTDTTAGQITAQLYLQKDFAQTIIGKYLFVVSSPGGHFAPLTNSFTVTNSAFAQEFTGKVMNNGTNVPYGLLLLFQPSGTSENPVGGVVCDAGGDYTIKAAPGTYGLVPVNPGFVTSLGGVPFLSLGSGQTITTNVSSAFLMATQSISGTVVDASNSNLKLPGLLMALQSSSGLLSVGSSDPNGNFNVPVIADSSWKVQVADSSLHTQGYVRPQNNVKISTLSGSVSGVTLSPAKATALFYGTVKDNSGNPLAHVSLGSQDQASGTYEDSAAYSDANGNYFAGALAGTWGLYVSTDSNTEFSNYVFSAGTQTSLTSGQAFQYNVTALVAANQISGNVQFNGNPVSSVNVFADATINGVSYQTQVATDNNGNYSLGVANGSWNVAVLCQGNNNSLDSILGPGNYQCPNNQTVNINNNNGTVNFVVQSCNGVQINTTSLPNAQVSIYYNQYLSGSSCSGSLNWSVNDPQNFPPGLTLYSNGQISGTPTAAGTYNFSVNANDGNGHSSNQGLTLIVNAQAASLVITNNSLPNGNVGAFYSAQLGAAGGQPPYNWSLAPGSANPPPGLVLNSSGLISGTPITNGLYPFIAQVTDSMSAVTNKVMGLLVNPRPALKLAGWQGSEFQMQLAGGSNQNYTIQMSTNLALGYWVFLFVTNNPSASTFIVTDPAPTNAQRFYRVLLGP